MFRDRINRTAAARLFGLRRKVLAAATGAGLLCAFALPASAQQADQNSAQNIETVVVSSTRLTNAGFDAPTPTTVLGANLIESQAKDNIFNLVTQLPSMLGSTGQATLTNGTSGGTNGLSSFNMFGLGTTRTLVLLDGERVVPSNVTGVADISLFPQLLIQRVDVVTGGASASWGSDAVAGVVNFVTNNYFSGFKANLEGGISTYGDNGTVTFQVAAGTGLLNDKAHVEVAAEFSRSDGVGPGLPQLGCCRNALPNGRTWFTEPTIVQYSSPAATPAGQPQYFVASAGQDFLTARYGIINNGPLQGTAFAQNGTPFPFNYGVGPNGLQGVPGKNVAGTVANCVNPFCIGGQTDGEIGSGSTLVAPLTRGDVYTRLSYKLDPALSVFVTVNLAQVGSYNIPNPDAWKSSGVTIPCNNAFLPGTGLFGTGLTAAQTQAACLAAYPLASYPSGFQFGSDFQNLGPQQVYVQRDQRRYVVGVDGSYNMFRKDWTWNSYYQHGENDTRINVTDITLTPNFLAALNAVTNSSNQVVCASAVAQSLGCVPFNPFGNIQPSQAQLDWLYGGSQFGPGPFQLSYQHQDVFSISTNGAPFSDWAGPVAFAIGFEYRQEGYNVHGDPAGNGNVQIPGQPPITPCNDALLNCVSGTNWYAGNFHNGAGSYRVEEGFIEIGLPLINDAAWGKADLDLAGRATGYSTSGYVQTWKVGLNWATPLNGVRLRALQSRDVRAPNLSELFAAPTTANGSNQDPWSGTNVQIPQTTTGNPNLQPEKSSNTQIGIVYQPDWIAGFSASVDYYRIGIKGQIATISQQNEINLCFQGFTAQCSAIIVNSGTYSSVPPNWNTVVSQAFNIASAITDGFNVEANYQFDLQDWGVPGSFVLRALGTHVSKFITNQGILGTIPIETAGTNGTAGASQGAATPHWKIFATETYSEENKWSLTLTESWITAGVISRAYIQCVPGACPLPTLNNPTINNNVMPGALYLAVGGSYNLNENWQTYFKVDNVTNLDPPANPTNSNTLTDDGVNPLLYDPIGRMYHVGVRVNL